MEDKLFCNICIHKIKTIKGLKVILLFLSASILLVHSLLPHHHLDVESNKEEVVEVTPSSFLDLLEQFVQVDLGNGHMEAFNQSQTVLLDLTQVDNAVLDFLSSSSLGQDFVIPTNDLTSNTADEEITVKQYYLSSICFRGPPVVA